jgi:SAM-dependent methyltransferase
MASLPFRRGRILHISPEHCLSLIFRPVAARYVRADYATADCDIRLDMTNMSAIAAQAFDVVIACDVLEHISDDGAALREVHRVLAPGGMAILSVPQFDDDRPTLEDPRVDSAEERERVYGQPDHVRNYGSDFPDRLRDAGLVPEAIEAASFRRDLVERHVLEPCWPLDLPFGWNRRRVYFAGRRG